MPKGRGSKRLRKSKPSTTSSRGSRPKGLVGQRGKREELAREIRRRQQAAEAGGATRSERKKTRQREEEATRRAARELAKAAKKK